MSKFKSRKFMLTMFTMISATIMTVLPPILTYWSQKQLIIMTATEWASIVSATLLFFNGADVWEKHVASKNGAQVSTEEDAK